MPPITDIKTYVDERKKIQQSLFIDESSCVNELIKKARLSNSLNEKISLRARKLVTNVRESQKKLSGIDAFLAQYGLSNQEGIVLMCLAEALLRIPDQETADNLIRDKILKGNWKGHLGKSDSLFVNASTWALMLTGKILKPGELKTSSFKKLMNRSSEPVIRKALIQAMRILGQQFVLGRTIEEALKNAKSNFEKGYRYSFDMLGEAAYTQEDADCYYQSYYNAIEQIARSSHKDKASISIKLSALHPRYEWSKKERVLSELAPRLKELCLLAQKKKIDLTIDAEEARRLDISLDLIELLMVDPAFKDWHGLGLAVQAYQKRAYSVIEWLIKIGKETHKKINIRLVKGAYWDSEIKEAQVNGYKNYPVFTRKVSTDISYLSCAQLILANTDILVPQFATHNAHTLASILEYKSEDQDIEFQRLHGMGEALYDPLIEHNRINCRVYAPVGGHEALLSYLVRRLLENGANTSFVNRIIDKDIRIKEIIENPFEKIKSFKSIENKNIPIPKNLYKSGRENASGDCLYDPIYISSLNHHLAKYQNNKYQAFPIVNGKTIKNLKSKKPLYNPSSLGKQIGQSSFATEKDINKAFEIAKKSFSKWNKTDVNTRANLVLKAALKMEQNTAFWIDLLTKEAGKTYSDAIAEIREAIDFCRYYAKEAIRLQKDQSKLDGPTGEDNFLKLEGRGIFVCISPWNFPLAIFTGQIVAALISGNCVIAKPAEQTSLIAFEAIKLFHEEGIPKEILHFLPGEGHVIGEKLINHPDLSGVTFTGSTDTARRINQLLSKRDGPILPFIAETGGINAMIVDSSALLEQVTLDTLTSAFYSAGQRCSAMRVLFIQSDIADKAIEMIKGAMEELEVNNPYYLKTDIGPVIDQEALNMLENYITKMQKTSKLLYKCSLKNQDNKGYFFPPHLLEIKKLSELKKETFGPVLHIIRYKSTKLKEVIKSINDSGYGLTLGIHSRIDETISFISENIHVGNCYVNRNMVGAVVGVQPFGGEGLSGTGPKAGGPNYLIKFMTERTLTINTTASGGNADLLSLTD